MLRVLLFLFVVFVSLYAIVEAAMTRSPNALPRFGWVFLTIFLPIVGPLLWFGVGRPRRTRGGTKAPDDDARFLRKLDDDLWRKRLRDRRNKERPEES